MKAVYIVVGDEVLLGQVVDTNAAFLGQVFGAEGIELICKWTVRDRENEIRDALERAQSLAELVVLSGGLGPTSDDLTKPILTEYFGGKLVRDHKIEQQISDWFRARGREPGPMNLAQADLPDNAQQLHNPLGTAQGMMWQKNGVTTIALPGVPYEFQYIIQHSLIPWAKSTGRLRAMVHRTLMTAGLVESSIAKKLKDWELRWKPMGIRLAYLPRPGVVRLRLSAYPDEWVDAGSESGWAETLESRVDQAAAEIHELLPGHVYGENEESLEARIGSLLLQSGRCLGLAESCTGGALSARLLKVPGASAYVRGGLVAYHNDLKSGLLGVKTEDLKAFGAVSETVVRTMAAEACRLLGCDYAVAISGIAGPDGGSPDKPVGTVYFGLHGPGFSRVYHRSLGTGRDLVVERAVMMALFLLWRLLSGQAIDEETTIAPKTP